MKNDYLTECGRFDNACALCFFPLHSNSLATFVQAGGRFCEAGVDGSSSGVIGWQIDIGAIHDSLGYVFSSPGLHATSDDYQWIFQDCAEVAAKEPACLADLFDGGRRVYAIVPQEKLPEPECESSGYLDYLYDSPSWRSDKTKCQELFALLTEAGAVVRVTAGVSPDDRSLRGSLLVSLPQEMSLRLRCCLRSASFAAERIEADGKAPDGAGRLSRIWIKKILAMLLDVALEQVDKEKMEELAVMMMGDSWFDTDIKELDLSVRSFNCLKRGNVHTVRDLLMLNDEELFHIRHLRQKQVDEIRKKLVELWATIEEKKEKAPDDEGAASVSPEEADEGDGAGAADPEEADGGDGAGAADPEEADGGDRAGAAVPEEADGGDGAPPSPARGLALLDRMIGLEDVKKQVRKIASFAKMKKELSSQQDDRLSIALNMEFVGNPGTAKTTVARIVAGILHEIGLLPEEGLVEVGRADLVGKYVGHTAPLVKEVFQKAKGKVLFIDEAYSLVDDWSGSYGDEAINTIVQEMENNRADTVVIFAGYQDKMKAFIDRNPGLRSRVPFRVEFADYSAEELSQIAELEAERRGFRVSGEAREALLSVCAGAAGNPEAGNGRFCRNLIENAILCYAQRVYGEENSAAEKDFTFIAEDLTLPREFRTVKKEAIGFSAA